MPDAPTNHLDPASIQREKQARAASPLYWCSPSVTVWEYRHMDRAGQDIVNQQCRAIERTKQNKDSQ